MACRMALVSARLKASDEQTEALGNKIEELNDKLLAELDNGREQELTERINGLTEERKEVNSRKQAVEMQLAGGMLSPSILQHTTDSNMHELQASSNHCGG